MRNRKQILGWVSSGMILLGLLVFPVTLVQGIADVQKYNSPFDEIDATADGSGFVPAISPDEKSAGAAPTLDVSSGGEGEQEGLEIDRSPYGKSVFEEGEKAPQLEYFPEYITIPAIELHAPVQRAVYKSIEYLGEIFYQWVAPDSFAVGWHSTSAPLGKPGNTVLNGHHNIFGEVFRRLHEVQQRDLIYVRSLGKTFTYEVNTVLRLKERFQPVEVRIENAQWIAESTDERLTLITCWPYESNTHRVVVVAVPVQVETDQTSP